MRLELGAPWEALLLEATTRRELPLGFTRQAQVGPRAVRDRVEDGNVDDGMVVASLKRGVRSLRVTPIGAIYLAPPRRGGCGLSQFEVGGDAAVTSAAEPGAVPVTGDAGQAHKPACPRA